MLEQLRDPLTILDMRLAAWDALDVGGVDQQLIRRSVAKVLQQQG
jgi:hypothetical protein